jgi:hypothetical protein
MLVHLIADGDVDALFWQRWLRLVTLPNLEVEVRMTCGDPCPVGPRLRINADDVANLGGQCICDAATTASSIHPAAVEQVIACMETQGMKNRGCLAGPA